MTTLRTPLAPLRIVKGGPMVLAGLSERYCFERRSELPRQWNRFAPLIGSAVERIGEEAYGAVSMCTDGFDYLTAVRVWDAERQPEGFTVLRAPARRYAVFGHEAHVSALPNTLDAIHRDWERGQKPDGPPELIEVYGPRFDPATGLGGVEIWMAFRG